MVVCGGTAAGEMGSCEGAAMALYILLAREQRLQWVNKMALVTNMGIADLQMPMRRRRR